MRPDRIDEARLGRHRLHPDDALHRYFVVVRHGQPGEGEFRPLLSVAKTLEIPTFIVGHVNKDGAIAGPKVMEHIVDTVLYFEGDKTLPYRVLRAVKNRYGSTNEIGMFDMTGRGLAQIENPSQVMLEGRPLGISGTCVACVMEGTRPVLSEIQALATKTSFPSPRRTASGFDYNRMYLLLAVLEKRAGYAFITKTSMSTSSAA